MNDQINILNNLNLKRISTRMHSQAGPSDVIYYDDINKTYYMVIIKEIMYLDDNEYKTHINELEHKWNSSANFTVENILDATVLPDIKSICDAKEKYETQDSNHMIYLYKYKWPYKANKKYKKFDLLSFMFLVAVFKNDIEFPLFLKSEYDDIQSYGLKS